MGVRILRVNSAFSFVKCSFYFISRMEGFVPKKAKTEGESLKLYGNKLTNCLWDLFMLFFVFAKQLLTKASVLDRGRVANCMQMCYGMG